MHEHRVNYGLSTCNDESKIVIALNIATAQTPFLIIKYLILHILQVLNFIARNPNAMKMCNLVVA